MASHKVVFTVSQVTTSSSTTPVIDVRDKKTLLFKAPTGCTQIAFFATDSEDGTLGAIVDEAGDPVVRECTAGQWVPMPDECLAAAFLGLVLTGPGAAIDVKVSAFL